MIQVSMEQDIMVVRISFCNHTLKKQNSMQSNGEKVINKTLLTHRCPFNGLTSYRKRRAEYLLRSVILVFSQSAEWRYLAK